jgi:hypothetical protein
MIVEIQQEFKHNKAVYPKYDDDELHSENHDIHIANGFSCRVRLASHVHSVTAFPPSEAPSRLPYRRNVYIFSPN